MVTQQTATPETLTDVITEAKQQGRRILDVVTTKLKKQPNKNIYEAVEFVVISQ